MAQGALVTELVDEGKRFIDQLKRDGFVVHEAFWLYDGTADRWRLYIAADEHPGGAVAAYKDAARSLSKTQPRWMDMNSVTLAYPSDPRTAAVREFQARYPALLP